MTTQPPALSDPADPTAALASSSFTQQMRRAWEFLWGQRVWLLFLIPFALACWKPVQNSFRNWGSPDSILMYQPLVPFAAALLIWAQRRELSTLWRRLQAYPPTDKRRRGNLLLLSAGCLTLLFGHLVYVDSFFALGLLLILAGTIQYLYGSLILRAVAGPLSLLLLMVNPPDSLITRAHDAAARASAAAASGLLSLFGAKTSVEGGMIRFPDHAAELTRSLHGANLLAAMVFIAFVFALHQRRPPLYTFCFMCLTGALALAVHLIRVCFYALTLTSAPIVAKLLLTFSPWLLILLLGAVVVYASQSLTVLSLRLEAAAKHRARYGSRKQGLSRRIEKAILDPLFNASDKGVKEIATRHRKASKNVNAFFKKLIPASKRKPRSRW
ncbi:MAG: exosortase/archaeosortase family protein [Cytophagales bacterium]|nr:exosortase/archaeosortase family protein [Armatimonadota bacterium]